MSKTLSALSLACGLSLAPAVWAADCPGTLNHTLLRLQDEIGRAHV